MNTYSNLPVPAIFAHRGASAHAPENTFASFDLAIEEGCDGIELDVMLTRDKEIVVIHDTNLERITQFRGKVSELNLSTIKQLDAGSFFDIEYKNEKIPTLREVFDYYGGKTFINIELKNYENINNTLPKLVAQLIIEFGLERHVLISSFNPIALRKFRHSLQGIPIGLLALPKIKGWWARSILAKYLIPHESLHPEFHDATPGLIQTSHKYGKRVHTYTVNKPEDLKKMINRKVDGFFTDDPLLARKILSQFQQSKSIAN